MNKPLRWAGDNIGLCAGDNATIEIRDKKVPGSARRITLAETLAIADEIEEYGLMRIVSCLSHAATHGDLSAADLAVWRNYEGRLEVRE